MHMPIPESIQNAPELEIGLHLYFTAWVALSTCRSYGMSAGPIPWLAIHEYANQLDLSDDQREALHYHIPIMDTVYHDFLESRRPKRNG